MKKNILAVVVTLMMLASILAATTPSATAAGNCERDRAAGAWAKHKVESIGGTYWTKWKVRPVIVRKECKNGSLIKKVQVQWRHVGTNFPSVSLCNGDRIRAFGANPDYLGSFNAPYKEAPCNNSKKRVNLNYYPTGPLWVGDGESSARRCLGGTSKIDVIYGFDKNSTLNSICIF